MPTTKPVNKRTLLFALCCFTAVMLLILFGEKVFGESNRIFIRLGVFALIMLMLWAEKIFGLFRGKKI